MSGYTTLVSSETLATHLNDPDWIIIDCRHDLTAPEAGLQQYLGGHIPGARFMHLDRDLSGVVSSQSGRHPLPDPEALIGKLGEAGIDEHTQVVAYDASEGIYAARLWWLLRWLGHSRAAVLDGGYQKWQQEGRPVTDALPEPHAVNFSGSPRTLTASAAEVLANLHGAGMCIVDARSPERYRGENETLDPVGGHIPGAINRFFKSNLQPDGTFKPASALRTEWEALLGDGFVGRVVHQCGSGVTACHNLLAMEVAGLYGSRLYPGSWSEWCSDPTRPITRGTAR